MGYTLCNHCKEQLSIKIHSDWKTGVRQFTVFGQCYVIHLNSLLFNVRLAQKASDLYQCFGIRIHGSAFRNWFCKWGIALLYMQTELISQSFGRLQLVPNIVFLNCLTEIQGCDRVGYAVYVTEYTCDRPLHSSSGLTITYIENN